MSKKRKREDYHIEKLQDLIDLSYTDDKHENFCIDKLKSIRKELIELKEEIVLDGFCNPIEMLSFGFSLGPVYLRIYRRRWKRSNKDKHFSNDYDLQLKGYKLVPELGIFLKEEDRRLSNKH
jgi:hypothetical protein